MWQNLRGPVHALVWREMLRRCARSLVQMHVKAAIFSCWSAFLGTLRPQSCVSRDRGHGVRQASQESLDKFHSSFIHCYRSWWYSFTGEQCLVKYSVTPLQLGTAVVSGCLCLWNLAFVTGAVSQGGIDCHLVIANLTRRPKPGCNPPCEQSKRRVGFTCTGLGLSAWEIKRAAGSFDADKCLRRGEVSMVCICTLINFAVLYPCK